jgi:predicted glutamine amidotransferase
MDGERHEDGWGIALFGEGRWRVWKSLQPIWEETERFQDFPPTSLFAVHARSAGFPNQKGALAYNQPYLAGPLCFAFNGMIHGMRPDRPLPGEIGAQKIFSWVVQHMKGRDGETTLYDLRDWVLGNARQMVALNVGIIAGSTLFALNQYLERPEYFRLHHARRGDLALICSEEIGDYPWRGMEPGEVVSL